MSTHQSRDEHIRKLAGLFDSPKLEPIQKEMRTEWGDCWDCRWVVDEPEYLMLGGVRKMIIRCERLVTSANGQVLSVMRSLPFRCPNFKKRKKLTTVEGGEAR